MVVTEAVFQQEISPLKVLFDLKSSFMFVTSSVIKHFIPTSSVALMYSSTLPLIDVLFTLNPKLLHSSHSPLAKTSMFLVIR